MSQIFHLKCTKFNFGWDSAPDHVGELTALPKPPRWIWGGEEKGGGKDDAWLWLGDLTTEINDTTSAVRFVQIR